MPTTITINERTKERLSDYKFGDWTLAVFEQPPEKVKQDKIFENVGYF
jgi:hypothetical protein